MAQDTVVNRQQELDKIIGEAQRLQDKYSVRRAWALDDNGKEDPQGKADYQTFSRLSREGFEIQKSLEADQDFERMMEKGRQLREVPEPSMPSARNHLDGKGDDREVAGYISLGDAVLAHESFREYAKNEYPRGHVAVCQIVGAVNGKNVLNGPRGEPMVPLTRVQRKAFEDFSRSKEMKAVPTLGTGVLDPDRIARIPQTTMDERLSIRSVISTGQTNATSIEYVRDTSDVPGLLAPTAHGVEKPEVDAEWTLATAPVRTIAGWMPVQNQQLEDWAQLRGLIDGRLRYAVKRSEEYEIIYGNNTPPHLEGILNVAGTTDIALDGRYDAVNDTLIDVVRRGITDVLVAGYQANAVVMHPFDWEAILLAKGSDERYVWAVVTDNNGSRIWGVQVVESIGAQDRVTGERNLIVGDWQMGAQLLDRMLLTVQVGLVDRQFVENMRTILAEERVALPIYAPAAFAFFETEAAGS